MTRVLRNLLENAVRHTPASGSVRVRGQAASRTIEVAISDTGEGIAPEHLAHIFDRFYRVDSARSRDSGGTGLGLAICKGIVEAHGGRIAIESVPGHGTTVRLVVPT
jgi:signal transduction histidine kinase